MEKGVARNPFAMAIKRTEISTASRPRFEEYHYVFPSHAKYGRFRPKKDLFLAPKYATFMLG